MSFLNNALGRKRIVISGSFIIVLLILWNTYIFFQMFKEEERMKIKLYASAMQELNKYDLDADITLLTKIIENNKNIPVILTDDNGKILESLNLNSIESKDSLYLKKQLALMKNQNAPIEISYKDTQKKYVYYRNSDLLYKLKFYPLALLLILGLFLAIIYMVFKSNKIAEQNKLWTGMAKETAHQIGTPLSSLLGWVEILRTDDVSEMYVDEIEKDVNRLNIIANRFSKIGSLPNLQKHDIVHETQKVFTYLKSRSSKQIKFSFNAPDKAIITLISVELFGWVIENLIKNAIDAMSGKGKIKVSIQETNKNVIIHVSDKGKGILKSQFSDIFKPGFTTKKRGWGLGLSLSKRIIESYHRGKIFVQKSELKKGTTFEIQLNKM